MTRSPQTIKSPDTPGRFILAWAGVLRSWAYHYAGLAVITFVPALALWAFAFSLRDVLPVLLTGLVLIIATLGFVTGLVMYCWRPRWFAPGWLKETWRRRGHTTGWV